MAYKGMNTGADPIEYPPGERDAYAVSYATGMVCTNCQKAGREARADVLGAYWEPADWAFCCCGCGAKTLVKVAA